MVATATVNGKVIAEADHYETVEGNVYEYFSETTLSTHCPWKGDASYYTIDVGGGAEPLKDAAWFYKEPYEKAKHIKDHVAFYKNKVQIKVD